MRRQLTYRQFHPTRPASFRTIARSSAGVSPLATSDKADARPAQVFLLDRVARGGGVLVVAGALKFERVERAAISIDDPQHDPRPIFLHPPASVILPQ